jgi:hypothetical protein
MLKVKELIEKLKKVNPELPVYVEGCDCIGESEDVKIWVKGALITRSETSHSFSKEDGEDFGE